VLQQGVLRRAVGMAEREEVDADGGVHGEVVAVGLDPAQRGRFRVGEPESFW
jgi:hypothetical protein